MAGGTYAVIPVKPFVSAKRRLSSVLNGSERAHLARLMLSDVLDSVAAARSLAGCLVVTCDHDAACLAEAHGAQVLREAREFGLACAVETALRALADEAGGVAVIPTDIPHATATTIDAVVESTADRGVTLVPATYDGGTNLLSMRPCHLLPPCFGPGSFQRHYRAALRVKAGIRIHICPMLGHDLDRPHDLETFLTFASPTRTQDYLAGLDIGERIGLLACPDLPAADFARALP